MDAPFTDISKDTEGPTFKCLDVAMRKLEMLSTMVNSRNQYIHEMRRKSFGSKPNTYIRRDNSHPDLGIVHMNTRYVSNVTIGLRMKKTTNNRIMPYVVPERIRTKSENSDGFNGDVRDISSEYPNQDTWMEHTSSYISVLDPKIGLTFTREKKPILKKSQSLENIRVENIEASQPSHEMEFVSSRIQKLKVME